jgi:hypothetical protein
VKLRITGIALFLFIPLVLVLYLRMPLGAGPSLALGVVLMIGHRFVARPWFSRHLGVRCFWCGKAAGSVAAPFVSKGETIAAVACGEGHAGRIAAFGRVVAKARVPLAALILVPVVLYLLNGFASVAGLPSVSLDAARWGFKIPIAAAVVALSFAWPLGHRMGSEPAIDFPVHNLFLLGIGNTLWVFRIVGIWWLVEGAVAVVASLSPS